MASKKKDWTDTETPIKVVHAPVEFEARKPEPAEDTFKQEKSWKEQILEHPVAKAYEKNREDTAAAKYDAARGRPKTQAELVNERQEAIKQYVPNLVKGIRAAEKVEKEHPVAIRMIPAVGISDFVDKGIGGMGKAALKAGIQDNPVSPVGQYMQSTGGKMSMANLNEDTRYQYDLQKKLNAMNEEAEANQKAFEEEDARNHPRGAAGGREPISFSFRGGQVVDEPEADVDLDDVKVTDEDRARAKAAAQKATSKRY